MPDFEVDADVTQAHIDRGLPGSSCACAIALAIVGAGLKDVLVDSSWATCRKEGLRYEASLSTGIQAFVQEYDEGRAVYPLRLHLRFELAGS